MLAITDAGWAALSAAAVALFAALGGLGIAIVQNRGLSRKVDSAATAADVAAKAVGTPNGKGNVVQMTEQILANQARMALDLVDLGERTRDHVDAVAEGLHRRLDEHAERIARLEPPTDVGA